MFKKTDPIAEKLDQEISDVLDAMFLMNKIQNQEYAKMLETLTTLCKIRSETAPVKMSADVKATVLANLAGIALILGHERAHVVTSKALGFVQKVFR